MKTIQLAGCIITDSHGRILVIHRNTERLHQWELPGGKLELGETLAQAAQREVLEEIGVEVQILRELGQADFIDREINWEYHWFSAAIKNGEPLIGEPDTFDGILYADIFQDNLNDVISPNLKNLKLAIATGRVVLS